MKLLTARLPNHELSAFALTSWTWCRELKGRSPFYGQQFRPYTKIAPEFLVK